MTCAVCHDPHASGSSFRSATEKVPLRAADYAGMLPREFHNDTGGRGVVCIACHSTTFGPHKDADLPRIAADAVPHASQSDVMFGQNAFFTEAGAYRSHARIEDSCVWCHAKPVPKPSGGGYPRGGVSHTLRTEAGLCARCHREFEGDELMAVTARDVEGLKGAIEDALAGEIGRQGGVGLAGAGTGAKDKLPKVLSGKPRLIELEGSMAVELAAADGSHKVPLGRVKPGGAPLASTDAGQVILKAAWNYFLLKNDGSNGAHNPRFVAEVLGATLARLREIDGG
ncbi:hypothetical protein [Geobacter sp.]|uniref:hypothetical protein n=1 Tax=Geobacter sp. TaxID=46610 RepID=UPI00261F852B|nr:hypothetical protein [Geobacter sp.]